MESALLIGLSNALLAAVLALVAFAASRLTRSAPVGHFLWTLVLVKLVTPPLFEVDLRPAGLLEAARTQPIVETAEVSGDLGGTALEMGSLAEEIDRHSPAVGAEPAVDIAQRPLEKPPARTQAPASSGSWSPDPVVLAAAVWISGSILWSTLAASRILRFRKLLRNAPAAPPEIVAEVREVAERLGLERVPAIVVVAARISPLVWTFGRRARLVLPEELMSSLDANERRTLFAHELAHLRRRDHWWRLLELVALAVYWWFPIAWWARHELRKVEEECCDGWVQWAFPEQRREYARTLLHTVDFLSPAPAALPEGVSGMGQVSLLERRLLMILQGRLNCRLPAMHRVLLLSFAALVLPWAAGVSAQEKVGKAAPPVEESADPDWPETEVAPPPAKPDGRIQALERQIERIEKEIQALRIGTGLPGADHWRRAAGAHPPVYQIDGETVILKDPSTQRTLWSANLGEDIADAEIAPDGKRLLVRTPGSTVVLDVATGKILQKDKKGEPAGTGWRRPGAAMVWKARGEPPAAAAGLRTDLVQLANALVEAEGAAKLAQSRLDSPVDPDGTVKRSATEMKEAGIQAETAKKKADLLRRMARAAARTSREEVKRLQDLHQMARTRAGRFNANELAAEEVAAVSARLAQAEMALGFLEEILAEPDAGGARN